VAPFYGSPSIYGTMDDILSLPITIGGSGPHLKPQEFPPHTVFAWHRYVGQTGIQTALQGQRPQRSTSHALHNSVRYGPPGLV